ncbi:MAG: hypothetical protein ACTTHM_07210 [Peptoanaerobacter stomatis]|uniref:hypothetical protein n=1 Tax=Peptoanaerobacter stomatis TaxID=796937 RepID=UPI003FA04679
MKQTPNYNLKKPDYTDVADIKELNTNMDILDKIIKSIADGQFTVEEAKRLFSLIGHKHNTSDINNLTSTIQQTKVNSAAYADNAGRANNAINADKLKNMIFNWSGQGGQPLWLWGGSDGTNMYVYNPSNFNVNYANTSGNSNNVQGFQFRNNNGRLEVLINGVWLSVGGRQYTVVRQGKLKNNRFDYSGGGGIIRYAQSSYKYGKTGYARVIVDGVDIEQSISNGGLQVIQDVEFKNSVSIITTTGDIDYLIQTEK